MDFQDVINDDAALHALLDGLDGDDDGGAIPRACDLADDPTPAQLTALLQSANDALRDTSDHIPTPSSDGRNTGRVLAAALLAVARLGSSARAHGRLREEAEARCAKLEYDVSDGVRALKEAQRAERQRAVADRDALARARDDAARERRGYQAAKAAATEARSAAAASANRAQVAEAALRRRDKEFAQLQKRVHAQLSGAQRPSLAVEVCGADDDTVVSPTATAPKSASAIANAAKKNRKKVAEGVEQFTKLAVDVERRRCAVLQAENETFREQLHAISEELDALLTSFPRVVEIEKQQQAMMNGVEVEDVELPLKSVDAREMLLPYESVAEKVDAAIVRKFKMLRRALCYQELVEADLADGLTVAHDEALLTVGDAAARTEPKGENEVNKMDGESKANDVNVMETAQDEGPELKDELLTSTGLPGDDEVLSEGLSKSSTSWEDSGTLGEDFQVRTSTGSGSQHER